MIEFREASKRYPGGTVALAGVDLAVPRGEFCVILGRSGAGKSTLLGAINGLTTLTGGEVHFDGDRVTRSNRRRVQRRIGSIHQRFHLVPRLSVLQNVLTGVLPHVSTARAMVGAFRDADKRRACELLARVGLGEHHIERRASELSGGEQQRVGIARAFLSRPDVLLADEPVASLDPRIAEDVMTLTRALSSEMGVTVLCSLHQVDLAKKHADRIVAMQAGGVVFDGAADELTQSVLDRIYTRNDAQPGTTDDQAG